MRQKKIYLGANKIKKEFQVKRKIIAAILILIFTTACGNGDKSPVIAKINGKKITENQFNTFAAFKRLSFKTEEKKEAAINHYLDREYLTAAIEDEKYLDKTVLQTELNEFKKEMTISRYFEKYLKEKVSKQAVKNYYNTHASEFENRKANIAHILIRTNNKMSNIEKRVKRSIAEEAYSLLVSGKPFSDVAKDFSGDTVSSKKGGELGWMKEGSISPEFSKTAFDLEPGKISLPFETPFGFHIVKLNGTPKIVKQPFDAVAGNIRYQLRARAKKAEMERLVARIK